MAQTRPAPAPHASGTVGDRIGARELVVLISAIMALMALGIDLMLPGFDEIGAAFDLPEDTNQTGQIITFYFFGLSIAQVIYGPLTDRFGRKPVLYLGIAIYVSGAAASALAPNFGLLLAARLWWGIGAAGARVVATSIIRDRFEGDQMARAMSQVMMVFVIVPVFAPTVGAAVIAVLPWQAMFWLCVICAGAVGLWAVRLPETLDPADVRPFGLRSAGRSYAEVARNPVTLGYTVASVFVQANMTGYLATSELMIGDIFGREAAFPLVFGLVAIGFGFTAWINGRMVERVGMHAMIRVALVVTLALGPILVAITVVADGRPSFWVFVPMVAAMLSTGMFLMPNLNSLAMTPVGHIAGAASAFTSAVRIGVGSVIAALATSSMRETVTPFAWLLLSMSVGAAITIFFVNRLARA